MKVHKFFNKIIGALVIVAMLLAPVPAMTVQAQTDPVHNVTQGTYFTTIQAAIDAANPGDTIEVAAGTYAEQLVINKDLTLVGATGAIITPPASIAAFYLPAPGPNIFPYTPLVMAYGGTVDGSGHISGTGTISLTMSGFTIDGLNLDRGTYAHGMLLRNVSGTISGNVIQNLSNASSADGISGIATYGDYDLTIHDNDISGFTFFGIVASGVEDPTSSATITNNFISAPGAAAPGTYSVGIGMENGAQGLIQGNTIDGNDAAGVKVSFGIEVVSAGVVTIDDNTAYESKYGIYVYPSATPVITNNNFYNNVYGIRVKDCTGAAITGNTVKNNSAVGIYLAETTNTAIESNTIEGNTTGVYLPSGTGTTVKYNQFLNNNSGGLEFEYDLQTVSAIDASLNYWGDPAGPSTALISGDVVSYPYYATATTTPATQNVSVERANVIVAYSDTIQGAIDAADDGDTITVAAGTYVEDGQIVIDKNLSIVGADKITTIIKPAQDTGSIGDARGWFLVQPGVEFNLSNVTLDGTGKQVYQAIRSLGTGTIDNNIFLNIKHGTYNGVGVVAMGGNMTFSNNAFSDIGRIGMMAYGSGVTDAQIVNNTYVGKGDGDHLDYGIEIGGGAIATITGNTISGIGESTTDWSSAAILVTDAYPTNGPAAVTIMNNTLANNYRGIHVGHGTSDGVIVVAEKNNLAGTGEAIITTTDLVNLVDGSPNWFGSMYGPLEGQIDGNVTFAPWCADAACTTFLPDANNVIELSGDINVPGGIQLNAPGVTYLLKQGTTINNNSPCFVVNADDITIKGEYPGEEFCIPTGDSAGIEVAAGVGNLVIENLDISGASTTGSAINFAGNVDGLRIANNKFHDFETSAIVFAGEVLTDHVIEGNMFMNVGTPAIVSPTTVLDAAFNSWGENLAPTITNVTTTPFTHADLRVETDYALYSGNQIAAGESITYTVKANLTEISGAEFNLTYPTALLDLTGTTDGTAFVGVPDEFGVTQDLLDVLTDGQIKFRGIVPLGTEPVTGTDVVLFRATFTTKGSGSGTLDFVEIPQGFNMTPDDPYYSNHVYPAGFTPADLAVIALPTITADGIEGYYLVDETREFTVSVGNPSAGGTFTNVLFRFEVTADDGDISLFQYDAGGTWLDMPLDCTTTPGTCVGYFGPSTGFSIGPSYVADTNFQVEFAADGEYPVEITLVDLLAPDGEKLLAEYVTETEGTTPVVYTVPTIVSSDITGPYQATDPQAFSLAVTVDPDMVGVAVFELLFDFPEGTVISYGGTDYTCTSAGCPLIPVTLAGGENTLPFTVTFPAGYTGDVTVSLFDTGWDPDRLLASETFDLVVYGNFAVDGKVTMQGRIYRGDVPMTLINGVAGYGPYTADSLDQMGQNIFFTDVAGGYYVVTTDQDRYLNIPGAMLVVSNTMTMPDLYLYGGNVNNDTEITIGDASMVGGAYGVTGDPLALAADANFDGRVNIQDLALVGGNYQMTDEIYADWLIPYEVTGVFVNTGADFYAELTGAFDIIVDGSYTGPFVGFEAPIAADVIDPDTSAVIGNLIGTYNRNGVDTLYGEYTVGTDTFYVIGIFPQSGIEGHFIGAVVDFAPEVSGITVAGEGGATHVAVGASLQMIATVTPTDAPLTDVIWSVWAADGESETDIARIDPITGVLTGQNAGTVTVLAKALDGSHVYGSTPITVP